MKTILLLAILSFLPQGADVEMKRLLDLEANPPETAPGKVGLGDSFMDAAKRFPKERRKFEDRAVAWYAKAWPDLDFVWQEKMRDRLHRIAALPVGYDKPFKNGGAAKGWSIPDDLWGSYLARGFGRSGHSCAQIVPAGKKNEVGYTGFHSNPMPASEGKSYRVSAWVYTDHTDADGTLYARFFDSAGKLVAQSGPYIPKDSPWWQKIECDFKAPANSSRVDLNFTMMSKLGVTFVDDVSVECDGVNLISNGDFEGKP